MLARDGSWIYLCYIILSLKSGRNPLFKIYTEQLLFALEHTKDSAISEIWTVLYTSLSQCIQGFVMSVYTDVKWM